MCIFVMRPAMKNNLVANVMLSHDVKWVNRKALQRFQVEQLGLKLSRASCLSKIRERVGDKRMKSERIKESVHELDTADKKVSVE